MLSGEGHYGFSYLRLLTSISHLLARRGMANRIGNLLGQLEFSDDQLGLS